MKIIKIVSIACAVLVGIVLIVAIIFLSTFDLNKYLDPIKSQASNALGRDVSIGHAKLDLNIFKGIGLVVEGITIAEDARFGNGEFARLDRLSAGIDAMAFITRREIVITAIDLESVRLNIIRDEQGSINAQTIGVKPADAAGAVPSGDSMNKSASSASPAMALPEILVKRIHLINGVVHFTDKNSAMPVELNIDHIDVAVENFSLSQPFAFHAQMAVLSNSPDIDIASTVQLDLARNAAHVKDMTVDMNTAFIQMAALKQALPALAKSPLPASVSGHVSVAVSQVVLSAQGMDGFHAKVNVKDGMVKLNEIPTAITAINADIAMTLNSIDLRALTAIIGSGTVSLKGTVNDYMLNPTYHGDMEAKSIKAEEILDPKQTGVELKALFMANAAISGASFDPVAAMKNLKGTVDINVSEGKIERVNVANEVLGKLSALPVIGSAMGQIVSSTLDNVLKSDSTDIKSAVAKISLADNQALIESYSLETTVATVAGNGTVGLTAMDVNAVCNVTLSPDISAKLIKSLKPLKGLSDEKGQIYIQGVLAGVVPKVGYMPDLKEIAKKVASSEATDAVNGQLDRALEKNPEVRNILDAVWGGSGDNNAASSTASADSTTAQPSESHKGSDKAKKLIGNIFNKILK